MLILLAGNVLIWFRSGHPIGFSDGGLQTMLYRPRTLLRQAAFSWSDAQLAGVPTYSNVSLMPLYLFGVVLRSLGASYGLIQALLWYVIELAGMLATRKWLSLLLRDHPRRNLVGTIGATFYGLNVMSTLTYWYWDKLNITLIACVPILLLAIEWSLRRRLWIGATVLAVAVFLSASVFLDGLYAAPLAVLCTLYWVVRILGTATSPAAALRGFARAFGSAVVALAANAWVIVPFLATAGGYYTAANSQINGAVGLVNATKAASWSGLVRFLPFGTDGSPWAYRAPSWRYLYNTPVFLAIASLCLGALVVGAFARRSNVRSRGVLVGALVIGICLQAGAKGPFGPLVKSMVEHLPFGYAFQDTWRVFAPFTLIGASGLFGLGLVALAEREWHTRPVGTAFAAILIVLVCGIYDFPAWTGTVMSTPITQRGTPISTYVSVPTAYQSVDGYLTGRLRNTRVLDLPLSPTSYATERWASGYDGSDQRWLLTGTDSLSSTSSDATPAAALLSQYTTVGHAVDFHSLLVDAGRLACGYIVVDGYLATSYGAYYGNTLHPPSYFLAGLTAAGLRPVFQAGQLIVFRVPARYVVPLGYSVPIGPNRGTTQPSAGAQIDPATWRVPLDAGGEWLVGLSENFSKDWVAAASAGGRTIPVRHVMIDGYANGWVVDLPAGVTAGQVTLSYRTQAIYSYGWLISTATWIAIGLAAAAAAGLLWNRSGRRSPPDLSLLWRPRVVVATAFAAMVATVMTTGLFASSLLGSPKQGGRGIPDVPTANLTIRSPTSGETLVPGIAETPQAAVGTMVQLTLTFPGR